MRTITSLLALTMVAGNAFADISMPEVQQALHQIMPPGEYASDHVFVCERRMTYRCDDEDNIVTLNQYLDEASQLQADFSVFTHLQTYNLIADVLTQVDQLPDLAALNSLKKVNIAATKLPLIEGQYFPINLPSLILQTVAGHDISLQGFENHQLDSLEVYASEASVDFKNSSLPNLSRLDLGNSLAVNNVDFSSFTNITSFSWPYLYNHDVAAYNTARIQFPHLQAEVVELDLSRKHGEEPLTEIPSYVFGLPNLYSLRFTGHDLTEVPEQLFAMPSLKVLNLDSNKIDAIGTIDTDSNLEVLSLNSNALTAVPAELFQLKKLRELRLGSNQLDSIATIDTSSNLEVLSLSGNKLSTVPAELFQLKNLRMLRLDANKLTSFPEDIGLSGSDSKLEILSLSVNQLTQFTEGFFQLSQLRELDFTNNKISTLPAGFFAMQSLRVVRGQNNLIDTIIITDTASPLESLQLNSNKLTQVPAELFQLENLQTLQLVNNSIKTLPTIDASNASLQTLYLHANGLETLPVGLFNHVPLQTLIVTGNKLAGLPEGISNDTLTTANFAGNKFTQVPDALAGFTALKKANFNENKIENFGEQWKQSLSLEELLLENNQLKTLSADMLNNLPASLMLLSLSYNQMVGELPNFTRTNPDFSIRITANGLWSVDKNIMQLYGNSGVLPSQSLPVRGIKVTEKQVGGQLVSYIQWGFPLMENVTGARTRGAKNSLSAENLENVKDKGVNAGPYVSVGYRLEIEYTQGDNAGKVVEREFNCSPERWWIFTPLSYRSCDLKLFSASYNSNNYDSSVASYGLEGSLAGAKITIYSDGSAATYWGDAQAHEQFVDELDYESAVLPRVDPKPFLPQKKGSVHYYHWLVLLAIVLIRVRRTNII